ncbi:ABC transporter ATP-binding protein, partial [Streptomyces sp. NPDC057674]
LLHLVGGLERPDSGHLWLAGEKVDGYSEARWAMLRRRHIGIVFQFFNLVSNLTVADNIELPALLAGVSPRQARRSRAELLQELGLEGRDRSMPGELSGGEQQRVALARALVNNPALLLADEPAGSLDSKGTRDVTRLLSRFHRRGQSILMVTHDARMASAADRVISFFDGRTADDAALGDGGTARPGVSGVLELRD